jgi:GDP-L-fucose synthase
LQEKHLLSGYLEETNEPYAIAKIAGIKLCESYRRQYGCNFISAMPTNLYGPNDNYDLKNSHVIPALIRKFHEAKISQQHTVEVWGSGKPLREFMHVDDLADACLFLMNHYNKEEFVNIGTGEELSIADLAQLIKKIVGVKADIKFDSSKPDGTLRKLMSIKKMLNIGWKHEIHLERGITDVYLQFSESIDSESGNS